MTRAEFLAMPPGTLYQKYEPQFFGGPCIKGETIGHDWYETTLEDFDNDGTNDFSDKCSLLQAGKIEVPMDFNTICRDGFFDDGQLFAVWSADDVRALIVRLGEALVESGAEPKPQ